MDGFEQNLSNDVEIDDVNEEDLGDDVEIVYLDDDEVLEEDTGAVPVPHDIQQPDMKNENSLNVEVIDLSRLSFKGHTRSVFSCDLSAEGQLAVTGGEDDIAYVWSTLSGDVYMECTGHKDSVTEVGFNYDSQYVATGDMGGLIQVWSVNDKKLVWCYEGDDLEWLLWHYSANVLMAGMQSGDVFVWQIPQGHCKVLGSHGTPSTCGKLLPDGKKIIVGYADGHIKLWDIKMASVVWQLTDFDDITCMEVNSDGSLLAIAPSSQIIKITDGKVLGHYSNSEKVDVETLIFDDEIGILVTGSLSGQICIWDVPKKVLRHKADIGFAVTSLKWASSGTLLISTTDGALYVCDARSGTLLHTLTGHKEDILSMQVSRDKSFVLTTSDDCTAKIFNVN